MDTDHVASLLAERGWTFVGVGFFCPGSEPTVDAFGPDGHEIRAYPPANYGHRARLGLPRCEVTDVVSGMSLWVEGVPAAHRVGWLMRKHKDALIHCELGVGDFVLDLESGDVVPEGQTRER